MKNFRLFPAVAGAAACLLVIKGLALFRDSPSPVSPSSYVSPHANFGRAITRAREGYVPRDPDITGAVGKKEDKPADGKQDAAAKDGKSGAAADARPDAAGETRADALPLSDSKSVQIAQAARAGQPADLGASRASPSERALLERLGDRREQIENRAREVDTREALLKAAEKKLDSRVTDLKSMEERLQASLDNREQSQATALKNLVTMYETMKPKEAARVFDRLDLKVLIPVVQRMNPRKMAEILAAMQPEAAEKLTVALASKPDMAASDAAAAMSGNELPRLDQPVPAPAAGAAAPKS